MIPHVFVNSQCGSFREHGYMGSADDLVVQAIVHGSNNGDVAGMNMSVSSDMIDLFSGRALPITITCSLDVQPGTIRIIRGSDLLAELYGWTP